MTHLPPPGEKARAVRAMFDRISPSYDRVNRLMTFGADQRWRTELVERLLVSPRDVVLDLACGTGDFAEICRARGAFAVGLDFSRGMLAGAARRSGETAAWVQGDALRLPFRDGAFTVAVSGFALRNFAAIPPVLAELARVLEPGGRLGLLEVDTPANPLIAAGHRLYFHRVVPLVGGLLADGAAYRYLPESAVYLPPERELVRMLVDAGFHRVQKRRPMFGAIQAITAERR
ncbi:ubiquinone/menaquinone biosynthesis methyltransferase [Tepidiforma sp.]|uniref:ubiquinone/menaquinone biosynthesis methyltransferase n=1 Tax=Tepidiforma sp. TaxID=2682230 RepID=UPI002ADDC79D|nr:ubiquinone/menaquinone biosynthesis methyltransferase [Tepidiforma sp.]